jgi:hypothetical protein
MRVLLSYRSTQYKEDEAMKKIGVFALAAIIVLGLTMSAQAVSTISDPWNPVTGAEKNLYQIFADPLFNGGSFANSQAIANTVPIVETFPGGLTNFTVTAYAKYASFQQNPGAYFSGTPGTTQFFSTLTNAFPANGSGIFAINDWPSGLPTNGVVGLFDDTRVSGGNVLYTELAANFGGALGQSNGLIFEISPTHYIVAFEDGAGSRINLGDRDYNDLVLNVTVDPVPVPPSVILMVSGLLGLMGLRRFRKI